MEDCIRCGVQEDEVRLFDAVYEGRMACLCERCSIIENIPIIKKPNALQLKESESGEKVFSRMKRLAGIRGFKEEDTFFREDKLGELEKNPELELPEKEKLSLVEHFHWEVMKNRRRKGLSQEQLAETLGESEVAIEMIEKAKLPENAESVIRKLEQFFQVKLRKITSEEAVKKEPVLLGEDGRELEIIPEEVIEEVSEELEPEVHCKIEIKKDHETPLLEGRAVVECEVERLGVIKQGPLEIVERAEAVLEEESLEIEEPREILEAGEDLNLKKADLSRVRISDLKNLHEKKLEVARDATRQEKLEEQERIEERQRLIEARKEELRLMKERESNELDQVLGGIEILDKEEKDKDKDKRIRDSEFVEEFDKELI